MTDNTSTHYSQFATETDENVYMEVSRAATASLVLGFLGLLSIWLVPLMIIPIVGIVTSIFSIININRYPNELTGKTMAQLALALNLCVAVVAPTLHTYAYLTEVPDGYTRTNFSQLKGDAYGYDFPPPTAMDLDGKQVFIKGYIHPTSIASGAAQKFILVPDLSTCCFGGQPKLTHMIEVTLSGETYARYGVRQIQVAGKLIVDSQLKPVADLQGVYYQLAADVYRGQ